MLTTFDYLHPDWLVFMFRLILVFADSIIMVFVQHQECVWFCFSVGKVMREMQENYYLVSFMFASQLYFYVLGPISLLGY